DLTLREVAGELTHVNEKESVLRYHVDGWFCACHIGGGNDYLRDSRPFRHGLVETVLGGLGWKDLDICFLHYASDRTDAQFLWSSSWHSPKKNGDTGIMSKIAASNPHFESGLRS